MPGGKYCDRAAEDESKPSSLSWWVRSADVMAPLLFLSSTAKDSRIVCRCCGGMEESGSVEVGVRFMVGRTVAAVFVRG